MEGSYDEYNMANLANSTIPATVEFTDISYSTTVGVIICPKNTYYFSGACYMNPIIQMAYAIYPTVDSSGVVSWTFNSAVSSVISDSFKSKL